MGKEYAHAESVESIAKELLPNFHSELAEARITYIFVTEASKKSGQPVLGKVRKVTGALEYLLQMDFIVEVALDVWQDLPVQQRHALVDHLLERCFGEEDEKTGEMKWSVRDPEVSEFKSILERHGAWNENLSGFVSVAKHIELDSLVDEVVSSIGDDLTAMN